MSWIGYNYGSAYRAVKYVGKFIDRHTRENAGIDQFADLILADVIAEGCPQDMLLQRFRERQAEIRRAEKDLIVEAQNAAHKMKDSGDGQIKELFGDVLGD